MKIKNRILLYNTLIVILSLAAIFAIGSFFISIWGRDGSLGGTKTVVSAMKLLDSVETDGDRDAIRDELAELGCSYFILSPDEIDGNQKELMTDELTKAEAFHVGQKIIVAKAFPPGLLIAIMNEEESANNDKLLMIAFIIVGCVSIAVIISIGSIFTGIVLKHISVPLTALTQGAGRVAMGELSQPIDYKGSDEFKVVCDSFDHMQLRLKSERDKNAAYEKARTDLVTGISHDLRTPLTSVKGYIKGIQDGIANTPEKVDRYLRTAYAKADEMDVLLQRLFFFSRVETGNLPLNKKTADLDDLIRYYVDEASLDPRLQAVRFETRFEGGPHISDVDAHQMRRVVSNLTENAFSYSGADPLVISLSVESDGDENVLTFADNGRGVTEGQLPHLFDQFWRGDSSRQEGSGSSGLGLYIVKYIIDSHGGSIAASSDGGLKLTIRLPKAKEDNAV